MRRITISAVTVAIMIASASLISQPARAQAEKAKAPPSIADDRMKTDGTVALKYPGKWNLGIITGTPMAGIHGEYLFIPELAMRVIALYIFGANFIEMNKSEYIITANLCLSYHIMGGKSFFDPVLMVGAVYSFHHWATKLNLYYSRYDKNFIIRQGNIQDITFGFGAGLNFICTKFFRIGLNLWFNYDYKVFISYQLKKLKGRRFILPVPIVEFTFLF